MTVNNATYRNRYEGNGTNPTFTGSFKIITESDVACVKTDALGVETALVLNTDFSVGSLGSDNFTVTYPISGTKLAVDEYISIMPSMTATQEADLKTQGVYSPEVVEAMVDKLTMIAKQLLERQARTPAFSAGQDTTVLELEMPEMEVSMVPGLNASGEWVWYSPTGGIGLAAADLLSNAAAKGTAYVGMEGVDGVTLTQYLTGILDGTYALSAPDLTSFANALHDHSDAAGGGNIGTAALGDALDTEVTLAANSDTKIASQKAVLTKVNANTADWANESISNASGGPIATGGTSITTVDLGTVVAGDRFLVCADISATKGATAGMNSLRLGKSAGTATGLLSASGSQVQTSNYCPIAGAWDLAICQVLHITVGGTYTLELYGASLGSSSTSADSGLQAVQIAGA